MLVALEKYSSSSTPSDPLTVSWPFDVEKAIQNQYSGE
jgi:hypothetical protein